MDRGGEMLCVADREDGMDRVGGQKLGSQQCEHKKSTSVRIRKMGISKQLGACHGGGPGADTTG